MNRTMNLAPMQRSQPLHERLGNAELAAPGAIDLSVRFPTFRSAKQLCWPTPMFSRLGLDTVPSDPLRFSLHRARLELGLTTIEFSPAPGDANHPLETRSLNSGLHIVPVFVDEPLSPETVMHAEQIELQFLTCRSTPTPSAMGWGTRLRDWKPILPSDLNQVDQMAARVELLRQSSDQPAVLVGGAIAAAAVYDDVRYLIDAGLDYICLLTDAIYGMRDGESHPLLHPDVAIEQAQRAILDSGRDDVPLLLSSKACNVETTVNWLNQGVRAVNLDGFLLARQPATHLKPSDRFGSFLGDYQRMAAPEPDWLLRSLSDFLDGLASHVEFHGFRELGSWTSQAKTLVPENPPAAAPAPTPAATPPVQPAATPSTATRKKSSNSPRSG